MKLCLFCARPHLRIAALAPLLGAICLVSIAPPSFAKNDAPPAATREQQASVTPPEPTDYRMDEYRSPVPLTLKGAKVIADAEAMKLWLAKSAVFIDVYPHPPKPPNLPKGTLWRETTHLSIDDAIWLPNVGYGLLSAETDAYFRKHLETLTKGDKTRQLVFFCLRDCWMSWNAAKRALSYGYTNVAWYRDGTDGWQEIGGFVAELHPVH